MFRRRLRPQTMPQTRTGAKFQSETATQSPANEWQQWMRAGVLVTAKGNMFETARETMGILKVFMDDYRPTGDAVLLKGEQAMCLGELLRTKTPDPYDRRKQVVTAVWYFLFPTGMYVADPECFLECETDSTV